MTQLAYILTSTLRLLVSAVSFLMMVRAILSWLPVEEGGIIDSVESFLEAVTEPFIMPVRAVIERFGWFEGFPLDMSFLITFILLSVIEMML